MLWLRTSSAPGSSPRMRGAPELLELGRVGAGIIPADAGSTQKADHQQHLQKDHPRGCGEHRPSGRRQPLPEGSSPRMRGARKYKTMKLFAKGIIPADAGSTAEHDQLRSVAQDHPRGCGEHIRAPALIPLRLGSSPRMRGAQGAGFQVGDGRGIIPADAGST